MIRLQARLWGRCIVPFRFGTTAAKQPKDTHADHAHADHAVDAHHDGHGEHDDHGDHGDHGHHETPYDWRDDFSKNPEYEQDILNRGVPLPSTYHYPFQHAGYQWELAFPANYNPKDLATNYTGMKHIEPLFNTMRAPEMDLKADVAHEYDYESEDLDFQPEDFHTQHFRKKGHMWMWVFVGTMPITFWCCEFFLQKYPDEDHWRFQRPPPLNWPDTEDTPDESTYRLFKSAEFNRLYEAGQLVAPFFEIKGGKKIFNPSAGVNQPMDLI